MSPVALSWSGGKDSALALWVMRSQLATEPTALITTFTADYGRVSMHGVRRELIEGQAQAAGLRMVEVSIPASCSNDVYEARFAAALNAEDLETVAFADLFLEDIRGYREAWFERLGRDALFPLWGRDTALLAREFIEAGFEAVLCCVDPRQLDPSFAGRAFDHSLLAELPAGIDPCGENGEFHTFVHAGPIFERPIEIELGETVMRNGFAFQDLLPTRSTRSGRSSQLKREPNYRR